MGVLLHGELAVGVAADEHGHVHEDQAVLDQLLERVEVLPRGVGIVVRGDVQVDGDIRILRHG
jgi:hypothetical protein